MQYRFGRNLGDLAWSRMGGAGVYHWVIDTSPTVCQGRLRRPNTTWHQYQNTFSALLGFMPEHSSQLNCHQWQEDTAWQWALTSTWRKLPFAFLLPFPVFYPLYSLFCISRNASHLSFDQMCPDTEALGLLDSWEFLADISFLMTPAVGNAETVATDLFPIFLTHN